MARIKSTAEIAAKFARVAPTRSEDYRAGVSDSAANWEGPAKAADASYKAGVQKAIAEDRRTKGITAAGQAKWQQKAIEKGVPRWPAGITLAEGDYAKGFGPYRDVIEATLPKLPPRGPKRSPQNIERVRAIVDALSRKKEGK
jgi:hypothetical protein